MARRYKKTTIAWGIKWKSNLILPYSIRHTRRDTITSIETLLKATWKQLRKEGYQVVKLEINEFQKDILVKQLKDPTQPFPQLNLFKHNES